MNPNPEAYQICACGRSFYLDSAYTNHRRSCKKSKTRLAGALGSAQNLWRERKRQRLEAQNATRSLAGSSEATLPNAARSEGQLGMSGG
jgi:hypothetical protein